ncbi:hypothetical protein KEF85_00470 [Methylomonas paludis]|uniref:Uncharacterized protein n=1 Tax=Methylomonas paludis TaxID=1173101 RepID=A0A975MNR2_9GAMM|nr:hypothetical protein [Methylomonas paludis]QWF71010.1 hypothetical protein KEF85_00470 [Methylomonas paludis]
MPEILVIMALLFAAYVFVPSAWFSKFTGKAPSVLATIGENPGKSGVLPEDSALKRHFITQLRSEVLLGLPPRPTDFSLQRHYDTLVEAEVSRRLSA